MHMYFYYLYDIYIFHSTVLEVRAICISMSIMSDVEDFPFRDMMKYFISYHIYNDYNKIILQNPEPGKMIRHLILLISYDVCLYVYAYILVYYVYIAKHYYDIIIIIFINNMNLCGWRA